MQEEQTKGGAGSAGPDRLTDLKDRVDGLSRLLDRYADARVAARRTRIGVVIVMLLVLCAYAYFVIMGLVRFKNEEVPKFLAELQSQSLKMAYAEAPDLMRRAQILGGVYRDELQNQLKTRAPEIKEKFIAESEEFANNVGDTCQAKIETKLDAMAERQKEKVMAAFPRLTDEATRDIVMANLDAAFQEATMNLLEDRVAKGEERLRATYDKILLFLPEGDREGHEERMRRAWENFLLWDLEGMKKAGD